MILPKLALQLVERKYRISKKFPICNYFIVKVFEVFLSTHFFIDHCSQGTFIVFYLDYEIIRHFDFKASFMVTHFMVRHFIIWHFMIRHLISKVFQDFWEFSTKKIGWLWLETNIFIWLVNLIGLVYNFLAFTVRFEFYF